MSTLGLSLALDSMAASQYEGLPFTSFLTIGGKVYGTTPDGLYLIEGDTDAGEGITWEVSGPMTDAGADEYKRARSATVSGPNTESAELAITFDSGQEPTVSDRRPGGRFMVGRDGAGRAVQFTVSGTGPVEMTGVSLDILVLGKKARG
uniref:Uncharacterized protein n=1 Tax=Desulfovibrio sp. U5L TaxID=596152 RepID=I2Q021_9BACT